MNLLNKIKSNYNIKLFNEKMMFAYPSESIYEALIPVSQHGSINVNLNKKGTRYKELTDFVIFMKYLKKTKD